MIRRLLKLLLICICIFLGHHASAQSLNNEDRRRMNIRLLELIEQYEFNSAIYDETARNEFYDLFLNRNVGVYSDLIDYKAGKIIPISEYIDNLGQKINVKTVIFNVKKGPLYTISNNEESSDQWAVDVSFEKSMEYLDENSVLFSSGELFQKNFKLVAKCVYDSDYDRFYIASIDDDNNRFQFLPSNYKIIQKRSENDTNVKQDGQRLSFNSFDQMFSVSDDYTSWNEDVWVKEEILASTPHYDIIGLKYDYTHIRVKPRFDMTLGNAFAINAPSEISAKSHSWESGIDFGVPFHLGRSTTLVLYSGLAYSYSKIELSAANLSCGPFGNDDKAKSIIINSSKEILTYKDVAVPLYLNLDLNIHKYVTCNVSFGAKAYFNGLSSDSPFEVSYDIVDSDGNVTGNHESFTRQMTPIAFGRKKLNDDSDVSLDLSAIAGAGINVNLLNGRMSLSLRAIYEYGLSEVYSPEEKLVFYDNYEGIFPLIYSPIDGKVYNTHTIIGSVDFNRKALWGELGIIFKL